MPSKLETRVGIFILGALAIFLYMGFHVGAFRFDKMRYNPYTMYFKDITGVSRKADVKISGVKVGWVDSIQLIGDGELQAEAKVMILKNYSLYKDAHAIVRQDGLLGPKYIEVVTGDPLLPRLDSDASLGEPSVEPVSIDELLHSFKKITSHVEEITESFKEAVGGYEGKEQLQSIFANLSTTAEKMASFSVVLDRSFSRNEENIDAFLEMGQDIRRVVNTLDTTVLPSFQESIEKISDVFDRDFDRVAAKLESTAEALEDASLQASDGFKNISSVAEKIDEGKGLLGKLINEDETYRDLKVAVGGLKNYFAKIDMMEIVFDSHVEAMGRRAENYPFEDSKGYFDIRIHPNEDYFYLVQLVSSEKGFVYRKQKEKEYCDNDGNLINSSDLDINDNARLRHIFQEKTDKFKRNTLLFGLQFGKIFHSIALRFGLFEGSAGIGIDIDVPLNSERFRWVTTFEAFDLAGWNRRNDRRPHLKWLNRVHFLRNIYLTFGADDFVSQRNANAFFGVGLRFGDDDAKYLLSSFGGGGGRVNDFR